LKHERVIVISPRKSGTHLIQRLLASLGYGTWGDLAAPAADVPRLSIRQRLELANLVLEREDYASLDIRESRDEFVAKTNGAWEMLARSWACRLGVGVQTGSGRSRPGLWESSFSDTPAGVSWFFHSLDVNRIDPIFLLDWRANKQPAIVLNLRDPRDALVSMANFLGSGRQRGGLVKTPEAQLYFPSYGAVAGIRERIDMILTDPCVPFWQDYERAISFYRHPDVCVVTFEDLVGTDGGGDSSAQKAAVQRVAEFLGATDCDLGAVASSLFDRQSFTFFKGQVGSWRTVLSDRQLADLSERYDRVITALGYEAFSHGRRQGTRRHGG
jgi:hypothetical protein